MIRRRRNLLIGSAIIGFLALLSRDLLRQPGPSDMRGGFEEIAFVRNEQNKGGIISYKRTWLGFYKKVYVGENISFAILPGQTKSFDFYKFDYAPMQWNFQLGSTISDAVSVRVEFYSTWVPGMPIDPNHPMKNKMR